MGLCAGGDERRGGCIRTSKTKHLMARLHEFLNDRRADKARRTGYEDTHLDSP
jgi:hypothetical protein